jgi:hypothetical protein
MRKLREKASALAKSVAINRDDADNPPPGSPRRAAEGSSQAQRLRNASVSSPLAPRTKAEQHNDMEAMKAILREEDFGKAAKTASHQIQNILRLRRRAAIDGNVVAIQKGEQMLLSMLVGDATTGPTGTASTVHEDRLDHPLIFLREELAKMKAGQAREEHRNEGFSRPDVRQDIVARGLDNVRDAETRILAGMRLCVENAVPITLVRTLVELRMCIVDHAKKKQRQSKQVPRSPRAGRESETPKAEESGASSAAAAAAESQAMRGTIGRAVTLVCDVLEDLCRFTFVGEDLRDQFPHMLQLLSTPLPPSGSVLVFGVQRVLQVACVHAITQPMVWYLHDKRSVLNVLIFRAESVLF